MSNGEYADSEHKDSAPPIDDTYSDEIADRQTEIMEDAFGDRRTPGLQVPPPVTDEELEEVAAIESGLKPHERIAQQTAEKTAVPETDRDVFIDPLFPDEDIITEDDDDKDMRVKATMRELSEKEIRFIVKYYIRHNSIRNVIIDFEDALPENMIKLGKELLSEGFVWAAEEARAYLRNIQRDLPMSDLEMIHAAFKYVEKSQPQQIKAIIDRFSESKNLDGSSILAEETIENLETLIKLYNLTNLIPIVLLTPIKDKTTPPST